jgi:hypothetical protein
MIRRTPYLAGFGFLAGLAASAQAAPDRAQAAADRVVIDAGAVGAPISPLVYGQFKEHLGRCIYGGLWAEMLEDRKFFYPVTGEAPAWEMYRPGPRNWDGEGHPYEVLVRSPWMIVGDERAVRMVELSTRVQDVQRPISRTPEVRYKTGVYASRAREAASGSEAPRERAFAQTPVGRRLRGSLGGVRLWEDQEAQPLVRGDGDGSRWCPTGPRNA